MKVTTIRMREDTVAEAEKLATELSMDNSSLLREALSIGLRELRTRLALEARVQTLFLKGNLLVKCSQGENDVVTRLREAQQPMWAGFFL